MENLDPNNIIVQFNRLPAARSGSAPRRYSAAQLQRREAVHLTIGPSYDRELAPAPARGRSDGALFAEWRADDDGAALHVFCGSHTQPDGHDDCAGEPDLIHRFLQAVRYADRHLFSAYPALDEAQVFVHCARPAAPAPAASWGAVSEFRLPEPHGAALWTQFEMPVWQSLNGGYEPI